MSLRKFGNECAGKDIVAGAEYRCFQHSVGVALRKFGNECAGKGIVAGAEYRCF